MALREQSVAERLIEARERYVVRGAGNPKLVYKKGFGPFAPEIYRVGAPYEYRGVSSDDAIRQIELAFKSEVDPESVACAVLEPVQGEGGFIPMPPDFPARLKKLLDRYGIRFLPPLKLEDAQLERGLCLLEATLMAAGARRA